MKTNEEFITKLKAICDTVAAELSAALFVGNAPPLELKGIPRILFPKKVQKRSDNIQRISEQEARVLFIRALEKQLPDYFYAIETPTVNKYNFKQEDAPRLAPNGESARSDLSLFLPEKREFGKVLNVEFKFRSCHPSEIHKDLVKFYGEPHPSLWFHVIKAENSKTFSKLLKKFSPMKELLKSNVPQGGGRECYFYFATIQGKRINSRWHIVDIFNEESVKNFLSASK